jgi:uncharacterized protein with GYD domain
MATYVILSTLPPELTRNAVKLRELADAVSQKLRAECSNIRWNASYVLMGRFQAVDIVEADSPADVAKATSIIERFGQASTETLRATPRKEFLAKLTASGAGGEGWRWELGHSGGF